MAKERWGRTLAGNVYLYITKPFARTLRMDLAVVGDGKWVLQDLFFPLPHVDTMNKSSFFAFTINVAFLIGLLRTAG